MFSMIKYNTKVEFESSISAELKNDTEKLDGLAKKFLREGNFMGIGWMACHPERYQVIDKAFRESVGGNKVHALIRRPHVRNLFGVFSLTSSHTGMYEYLPNILVEKILADGMEGGNGKYPGIEWAKGLRFDDPTRITGNFALLEKLLDERLISRFTLEAGNKDKSLVMAAIGESLVYGRARLEVGDQVSNFDHNLTEYPLVKKAMRRYWQERYWEKSGTEHGRHTHDIIKNVLGGDVYMCPRRDDLDMSISGGREWVLDEIKKNSALGKEIIIRLKRGYELHWFLCDLSPSKAIGIIGHIIKGLGPHWRDPEGRNIAHALMAQTNPTKRAALISLASNPDCVKLFLTPDNLGEIPLDMARRIKGWEKHQDLASKLARKSMSSQVQEVGGRIRKRTRCGAVRL